MHSALEVITPASCLDLTVLATAKAELGIPDSDTSQDARIGVLIKQASSIVANYCDQQFGAEEVQEIFWTDYPAEWTRSFLLSREPVITIDSVIIDGALIDPSGYRLARGNYLNRLSPIGILGLGQWTWTSEAIIQYTAGYVLLDNLPYGIERAALSLIKEFHFATGGDPHIRSEEVPGVRTVTYDVTSIGDAGRGMLSPEVTALLAPYKNPVFA